MNLDPRGTQHVGRQRQPERRLDRAKLSASIADRAHPVAAGECSPVQQIEGSLQRL